MYGPPQPSTTLHTHPSGTPNICIPIRWSLGRSPAASHLQYGVRAAYSVPRHHYTTSFSRTDTQLRPPSALSLQRRHIHVKWDILVRIARQTAVSFLGKGGCSNAGIFNLECALSGEGGLRGDTYSYYSTRSNLHYYLEANIFPPPRGSNSTAPTRMLPEQSIRLIPAPRQSLLGCREVGP